MSVRILIGDALLRPRPLPPHARRMEWLFFVLDGHPNEKKADIICAAATPEVGLLTEDEARGLILGLGLVGF